VELQRNRALATVAHPILDRLRPEQLNSKKPTTCRIVHLVRGRLCIKAGLVWMTL
jgi:hypothetical protein